VSMSYKIDGQSSPLRRIAHVEVGGRLGGSLVGLGSYLRNCDTGCFDHEVVFFEQPPGSERILGSRWPAIDMGFAVPPLSRPDRRESLNRVRTFLTNRPRLSKWLTIVRGGWQLLASLPRAVRLARHFRRQNYDLIHCNNSFTYQVPTVLGAWFARKPLVCHFRTIRRLTPWESWLSRRSIVIVAVSRTVADALTRQKIQRPIVVCYNPRECPSPSPEATTLRCELLQDGTALVGTVSRLEDGKGIEDLLVAANLLQSRWPNVRYVIVGDGNNARALEQRAAELGLQARVHFTGFRSNVSDYYASMDIFVCPSLAEGAQGVVIEAMLAGRPTVATGVGSVQELIREGDNGLIVNPSDPQSLAGAIESLLGDSKLGQAMGARAAASARHLCDPVAQARMIDQVFARVFSCQPFTNVVSKGTPEHRSKLRYSRTAMDRFAGERKAVSAGSEGDTPKIPDSTRNFYENSYATDRRRDAYRGLRFTKMCYRAALQHCIPRLRVPGSRVLEVGCGYGLLGTYLSQLGARFIGVDIALSALSQFPKSSEVSCHPVVADATGLPFADASFDLVFCIEVLEHTLDPHALLDECFRVVRPGGHLVFSCPNYFSLVFIPKLLAELGVPYFREFVGRQFIDRWTTSFELRRLLGSRGIVELQRAVRLHPPFFEEVDYRLSEKNPLRRINDWIFAAESRWGDSFPLNYIGQHTLCMVQAGGGNGRDGMKFPMGQAVESGNL
jgi:glycosyltransferase involved in cell wall biosynthesis/2-polyprenyl-3-methyl-5-hydroxy-6-metoxy-1,4-benzoquinol methylase